MTGFCAISGECLPSTSGSGTVDTTSSPSSSSPDPGPSLKLSPLVESIEISSSSLRRDVLGSELPSPISGDGCSALRLSSEAERLRELSPRWAMLPGGTDSPARRCVADRCMRQYGSQMDCVLKSVVLWRSRRVTDHRRRSELYIWQCDCRGRDCLLEVRHRDRNGIKSRHASKEGRARWMSKQEMLNVHIENGYIRSAKGPLTRPCGRALFSRGVQSSSRPGRTRSSESIRRSYHSRRSHPVFARTN